jgi:hypothetical protein
MLELGVWKKRRETERKELEKWRESLEYIDAYA